MTNNKAIEDFHPLMCSLEVLHAEASTKLTRTQWETNYLIENRSPQDRESIQHSLKCKNDKKYFKRTGSPIPTTGGIETTRWV